MLHVRLLNQDFFCLVAKSLNLGFLDVLALFELIYPLIDVEALLLCRHIFYSIFFFNILLIIKLY